MGDPYNSQLFSSLLQQSSSGPVQGAIAGGRPLGGLLPDLTIQPLINLQANGLFTGKAICTFGSPSKAAGSKYAAAIQGVGDAFLRSIANHGIQPMPVQNVSFADLGHTSNGLGRPTGGSNGIDI